MTAESTTQYDENLINFQSALTDLGDKVAIIDREYTIIFQNTLCQKVYNSKIGIKCHEGFRNQDTICPDCPAQQVFLGQGPIKTEHLCSGNGHDEQWVELIASPLTNKEGETIGAIIVQRDVTAAKRMMAGKDLLVRQLHELLNKTRTPNGIATICMFCKKTRDEHQEWIPIETFLQRHHDIEFSHGICLECGQKQYPEFIKQPALAQPERTLPAETTQRQQEQQPLSKEPAESSIKGCRPSKHRQPKSAASIKITPREQQILLLVAKGYTSKVMGELLGLSIRTIERHRANMLKKLSQKNSAALIQSALRQGLL